YSLSFSMRGDKGCRLTADVISSSMLQPEVVVTVVGAAFHAATSHPHNVVQRVRAAIVFQDPRRDSTRQPDGTGALFVTTLTSHSRSRSPRQSSHTSVRHSTLLCMSFILPCVYGSVSALGAAYFSSTPPSATMAGLAAVATTRAESCRTMSASACLP